MAEWVERPLVIPNCFPEMLAVISSSSLDTIVLSNIFPRTGSRLMGLKDLSELGSLSLDFNKVTTLAYFYGLGNVPVTNQSFISSRYGARMWG